MRLDPYIFVGALLAVGSACMLAGYLAGCFHRDEVWRERLERVRRLRGQDG